MTNNVCTSGVNVLPRACFVCVGLWIIAVLSRKTDLALLKNNFEYFFSNLVQFDALQIWTSIRNLHNRWRSKLKHQHRKFDSTSVFLKSFWSLSFFPLFISFSQTRNKIQVSLKVWIPYRIYCTLNCIDPLQQT